MTMPPYSDEEPREKGGIRWLLTDDERQHIASLLDTEGMNLLL